MGYVVYALLSWMHKCFKNFQRNRSENIRWCNNIRIKNVLTNTFWDFGQMNDGKHPGGGNMHNIFALLPHCDAFWSQIRSIHTDYSNVPNVILYFLLQLLLPPFHTVPQVHLIRVCSLCDWLFTAVAEGSCISCLAHFIWSFNWWAQSKFIKWKRSCPRKCFA